MFGVDADKIYRVSSFKKYKIMLEKITGIESLLLENTKFNDWCEDLGSELLNEKYLNKNTLADIIKNKILSTEGIFYKSLCSELELKIDSVKSESTRAFKTNSKKEYIELGFLLSSLNKRLKTYNVERTKSFQRNSYHKLRKHIKETGNEGILETFKTEDLT